MRKLQILLAIFIAGCLLATPYLFGLWTKKEVNILVSQSPLPPGLYLEVQQYKVGYASSEFVLYVKMTDPGSSLDPRATPPESIEFTAHAFIKHGPLFTANNRLNLGMAYLHANTRLEDVILMREDARTRLKAFFEEDELVTIDALVGLTGKFDISFKSTKVNFEDPTGLVQWGGFSGNVIFKGGSQHAYSRTELILSPLLLQSKSEHPAIVDSAETRIFSETEFSKNNLWVGTQSLSIPSFYLKDENGNVIHFDNFSVKGNSDTKSQLAEVNLKAHADNVAFFTQEFKNIDFSMMLSKLDVKSLVAFANITNNASKTMTKEERQAMTFALINMLASGAEFNLSHVMKMDSGDVSAKINLTFPDLSAKRETDPPETLAQQLIMKLNATLQGTAPREWLANTLYSMALARMPENAPDHKDPKTGVVMSAKDALKKDIDTQLSTLLTEHILVSDGSQDSFIVTYKDGNFGLNGTTLNQEDISRVMSVLKADQALSSVP